MEKIELLKAIGGNEALAAKIIQMWKDNASAAEIAAALAEAGLPAQVSQVEEVLAEAQEKQAKKIALEKIDDSELDKVAGGNIDCNNVSKCFADWACFSAWNNCWRHENCRSNGLCDTNAGCDSNGVI